MINPANRLEVTVGTFRYCPFRIDNDKSNHNEDRVKDFVTEVQATCRNLALSPSTQGQVPDSQHAITSPEANPVFRKALKNLEEDVSEIIGDERLFYYPPARNYVPSGTAPGTNGTNTPQQEIVRLKPGNYLAFGILLEIYFLLTNQALVFDVVDLSQQDTRAERGDLRPLIESQKYNHKKENWLPSQGYLEIEAKSELRSALDVDTHVRTVLKAALTQDDYDEIQPWLNDLEFQAIPGGWIAFPNVVYSNAVVRRQRGTDGEQNTPVERKKDLSAILSRLFVIIVPGGSPRLFFDTLPLLLLQYAKFSYARQIYDATLKQRARPTFHQDTSNALEMHLSHWETLTENHANILLTKHSLLSCLHNATHLLSSPPLRDPLLAPQTDSLRSANKFQILNAITQLDGHFEQLELEIRISIEREKDRFEITRSRQEGVVALGQIVVSILGAFFLPFSLYQSIPFSEHNGSKLYGFLATLVIAIFLTWKIARLFFPSIAEIVKNLKR